MCRVSKFSARIHNDQVIARSGFRDEAISYFATKNRDCFVASLLSMNRKGIVTFKHVILSNAKDDIGMWQQERWRSMVREQYRHADTGSSQ